MEVIDFHVTLHVNSKQTAMGTVATKEKKYPEFSRLFQSHKLTFPQVTGTKSKCNNDLHQGSFHINSSNFNNSILGTSNKCEILLAAGLKKTMQTWSSYVC